MSKCICQNGNFDEMKDKRTTKTDLFVEMNSDNVL